MRVFFSWQSDLSDEKRFIRKTLQDICDDLDVEYDEDTRGTGSAEFVTDILLRKIKNTNVFVADVTTVGTTLKSKKLSNPNVCFELGYAECHLGRQQIILTFNEAVSSFDDLPFDLNKRNSVRFKLPAQPSEAVDYKKRLKKAIEKALEDFKPDTPSPGESAQQLNKYEKTLLYWALHEGEAIIIHRPADRRTDAICAGSVSGLFYRILNKDEATETSRFKKAIAKLEKRELIISHQSSLGIMTSDPSWVLDEAGEDMAKTINDNEILALPTDKNE